MVLAYLVGGCDPEHKLPVVSEETQKIAAGRVPSIRTRIRTCVGGDSTRLYFGRSVWFQFSD